MREVLDAYAFPGMLLSVDRYGKGHINDTFCAVCQPQEGNAIRFIIQRLSERLVCGECGTLYRRCTWKRNGKTRIVWRCVSRLDYGTKYCHQSPTMDEEPLQRAIMTAINSVVDPKETICRQITEAAVEETGILS